MKQLERKVIDLSRPDVGELEIQYVTEVLRTPHLSLGPMVLRFESQFAAYVGSRYAIAVNSGTSGLHLCVRALSIVDDSEVITTPFSFVASANCLLFERAVPVFVDVDPRTLNLNVEQIEAKITPKTRAILPVHVFGLPCDMDQVRRIAEKHRLRVIEDACEAIGATYQDRRVGTYGDCAVFAFYPNKQMTTGEGGIVVTDNAAIAALVRSMRDQGRDGGREWLAHQRLGYNYRLSDIHCALGCAQLERIGELLAKRERVAGWYTNLLSGVEGITLPYGSPDRTRSWFVYVVVLEERYDRDGRDGILRGLRSRGISCGNYFPPIHLQPFYVEMFGYRKGNFPVAEAISDRTIALPFYGNLGEEDVRRVVEALSDELRKAQTAGRAKSGVQVVGDNVRFPHE